MKYVRIVIICLIFSNGVQATDWGGIWNTDWGEVRLVQKGKVIVGTYSNKGHVLVHTVNGNTVKGIFWNGTTMGDFKWTRNGSKFKGKWAWKNKPLVNTWNGQAIVRKSWKPLEGIWETSFGNIHMVQNNHNYMAGTYGASGYVYGKYDPQTKILKGRYTNNGNTDFKTFEMKFSGRSFNGKYEQRNWGSWTGNLKSFTRKIIVNLQSVKLYKANGVGKSEKGKVHIASKVFDQPINKLDTHLLKSTQNILLSEGQSKNYTNKTIEIPVLVYKKKLVDSDKLDLQFTYDEYRNISNALDTYRADRIDLQEVVRFLTGDKPLSGYANGPDGRKRLANTNHTFWLTQNSLGKTARGYAFINFKEKQKWGYFYTVAIEPL